MNRRNLWFLTLFSLILVLGVYYVTLPSEIFNNTKVVNSEVDIEVSEEDKLVSLKVERDEKEEEAMKELQDKLISKDLSSEEKNKIFEELQILNLAKGKELMLEELILDEYNIKSFIEIKGNTIKVVINSDDHDTSLANNIMRTIQSKFDTKQYITIKFS